MELLEIRKPKLDEWQDYKSMRLRALKEFPFAFSSDYEMALTKDDEHWKGYIKRSEEENFSFMLFGYIEGKLVGMVSVYWEESPKIKHIANLVGVYVDSNMHGKGIGARLINSAIDKVKKMGFRKIKLGVSSTNNKAINLYKKAGFTTAGILQEEIFSEGRYYDEFVMEKYL